MKKVNVRYYLLLLALWPGVIALTGMGLKLSRLFLLLPLLYVCWCIFSQNIIYALKKKGQLKENFDVSVTSEAEWSTFWFDRTHGELAVLCTFHPFRIQYIPVKKIWDVSVHVDRDPKAPELAALIVCMFDIDGKKYRCVMFSKGRFSGFRMDGLAGVILKQATELTEEILACRCRLLG